MLKVVLTYSQQKQVDMQDLIQAGMYGLGRGLDKFDPSRGNRVSTVAYMWIKEAVGRVYNESARTIIISERTLTNVGLSHYPSCLRSANALFCFANRRLYSLHAVADNYTFCKMKHAA